MLKTFEAGKNAQELGIDTNKKFVVVENGGLFPKGTILTLYEDDNTPNPFFVVGMHSGKERPCFWQELAYAPNQKTPKTPKQKPYKFIVIWEEETDPVKFFYTENEAKKFIKTLPENAHSIQLIEIKTLKKVEITQTVQKKIRFIK